MDVAIIGMACRLPGAQSYREFWQNLRSGIESIHRFGDAELAAAGVPAELLNDPRYVKAAPILADHDCFDATLFRYSSREAAWMDPQHRQVLECAWESLEDAGYDPHRYPGRIGLFTGAGGTFTSYLLAHSPYFIDYLGATACVPSLGNDKDFIPTRVSYKLDLRGPSINVQTACSTSLVAVHLACRSLLDGEAEMALAGAVSVRVPQVSGYYCRDGDIVSPDGRCRPFDAAARGTLFGSGVGFVLLKPLTRAIEDGDHIRAVIRGTAVNNDGGEKLSYTASTVEGQERCIRAALARADVDPATISYVEAHATATLLGDPVEIDALNRAFGGSSARTGSCRVGSVKGNIGHLEAAAGIASLIKTVLCLEHRQLPPSLHCAKPSPRINFEGGPFTVQTELEDWAGDSPRRACVNGLGLGGTNAHILLEEWCAPSAGPGPGEPDVLFLTAADDRAMRELAARMVTELETRPGLDWNDVCHTMDRGRTRLAQRLALAAGSRVEAAASLRKYLAGEADSGVLAPGAEPHPGSVDSTGKLFEAARAFLEGRPENELARGPRRRVPLPTYPFAKQRHGLEERRVAPARTGNSPRSVLGPPRISALSGETTFEVNLDLEAFPFVAEHLIFGRVVVPGAMYAALVMNSTGDTLPPPLSGVDLARPLTVGSRESHDLQVVLTGERRAHVFSRPRGPGRPATWTRHLGAELLPSDDHAERPSLPRDLREGPEFTDQEFYEGFRRLGVDLGPSFRVVRRGWRGTGTLTAELIAPHALQDELARYFIHPVMLDGCFQLIDGIAASSTSPDAMGAALYLPLGFERLTWYGRPGGRFFCHARLRPGSTGNEETLTADLTLFDADHRPLADIRGFTAKRSTRAALIHASRPELEAWLHRAVWRPAERPSRSRGSTGRWLVLGDEGRTLREVVKRLCDEGHNCVPVVLGPRPLDRNAAREHLAGAGFDLAGVMVLQGVGEAESAVAGGEWHLQRQEKVLGGTLALVQAILEVEPPRRPRLLLVTRGAQAIDPDHPVALDQSTLWGFVRALCQEQSGLIAKCVDLDPRRPLSEVDELLDERVTDDLEMEVALRDRQRLVRRLVPGTQESPALPRPGGEYRLSLSERGVLDNLRLEPAAAAEPGPGQVVLEVKAAGLNFRDVLNALGRYPGDPGALGMECAGIVRATGPGVERLKVGDQVVALAQGSMASTVIATAALCVPRPPGLTFAQAASMPVIFSTVKLALERLARLERGQRVLVHGAAGGVGWAAIQIARQRGAEVIATASAGKWGYLREQGVDHVFDSRSPDFAGGLMRCTGGDGVHVLLNCLPGAFIPASLQVLARGGHFVEIGKQGIWSPERMAAERPDVRYHILALDDLMMDSPETLGAILQEIVHDVASGALQPPPLATYPMDQAPGVFRKMQRAQHIGKIVLQIVPELRDLVRADASYLITGGTGGLGTAIAGWLARQGARHLWILGRGDPSPGARASFRQLEEAGVGIRFGAVDVSSDESLARELREGAKGMPPLGGIVHAAGVVDDGLVPDQTWDRFRSVLAPKVAGAWNLHQLSRESPVDFFVLFSSIASVLGTAGQSGYAAANAFLDGLAHERRRLGLAGLSIQWGAWNEVGMAARLDLARRQALQARGHEALSPELGCDLFERLLARAPAEAGAFRIDWQRYRTATGLPQALLGEVTAGTAARDSTGTTEETTGFLDIWLSADRQHQPSLLTRFLHARAAHVLGLEPDADLDPDIPFTRLGLDSLMAVELSHVIRTDLRPLVEVPPTVLYDHPTMARLVAYLGRKMTDSSRAPDRSPE